MKAKFLALTWPQRVTVLLQGFLIVLFSILYAVLGRQQVIEYKDALFRYRSQGDTAVYSGKLNGQKAVFTVSPGPEVEFRLGDTLYGPYTIIEDPTAVPQENEMADILLGVEIRRNGQILFRGAYFHLNDFPLLYAEDGSAILSGLEVGYEVSNPEPDVYDILRIALEPDPVQRGHWGFFFLGVLICAACTLLILFAGELFRHNLCFIIRDPEAAEPSDWELFMRWFRWVFFTVIALVSFVVGLNAP